MEKSKDEETFVAKYERVRPDKFSSKGLEVLYDHLTYHKNDTWDYIKLNVTAICCVFSEYKNFKDFQRDFGNDCKSLEQISNYTTVIKIPNTQGFIIQNA